MGDMRRFNMEDVVNVNLGNMENIHMGEDIDDVNMENMAELNLPMTSEVNVDELMENVAEVQTILQCNNVGHMIDVNEIFEKLEELMYMMRDERIEYLATQLLHKSGVITESTVAPEERVFRFPVQNKVENIVENSSCSKQNYPFTLEQNLMKINMGDMTRFNMEDVVNVNFGNMENIHIGEDIDDVNMENMAELNLPMTSEVNVDELMENVAEVQTILQCNNVGHMIDVNEIFEKLEELMYMMRDERIEYVATQLLHKSGVITESTVTPEERVFRFPVQNKVENIVENSSCSKQVVPKVSELCVGNLRTDNGVSNESHEYVDEMLLQKSAAAAVELNNGNFSDIEIAEVRQRQKSNEDKQMHTGLHINNDAKNKHEIVSENHMMETQPNKQEANQENDDILASSNSHMNNLHSFIPTSVEERKDNIELPVSTSVDDLIKLDFPDSTNQESVELSAFYMESVSDVTDSKNNTTPAASVALYKESDTRVMNITERNSYIDCSYMELDAALANMKEENIQEKDVEFVKSHKIDGDVDDSLDIEFEQVCIHNQSLNTDSKTDENNPSHSITAISIEGIQNLSEATVSSASFEDFVNLDLTVIEKRDIDIDDIITKYEDTIPECDTTIVQILENRTQFEMLSSSNKTSEHVGIQETPTFSVVLETENHCDTARGAEKHCGYAKETVEQCCNSPRETEKQHCDAVREVKEEYCDTLRETKQKPCHVEAEEDCNIIREVGEKHCDTVREVEKKFYDNVKEVEGNYDTAGEAKKKNCDTVREEQKKHCDTITEAEKEHCHTVGAEEHCDTLRGAEKEQCNIDEEAKEHCNNVTEADKVLCNILSEADKEYSNKMREADHYYNTVREEKEHCSITRETEEHCDIVKEAEERCDIVREAEEYCGIVSEAKEHCNTAREADSEHCASVKTMDSVSSDEEINFDFAPSDEEITLTNVKFNFDVKNSKDGTCLRTIDASCNDSQVNRHEYVTKLQELFPNAEINYLTEISLRYDSLTDMVNSMLEETEHEEGIGFGAVLPETSSANNFIPTQPSQGCRKKEMTYEEFVSSLPHVDPVYMTQVWERIGENYSAVKEFIAQQMEVNSNDNQYHTLLSLFPQKDPAFLREKCNVVGNDEAAFKHFIEEQLQDNKIQTQYHTLLAMFPQADPAYLRAKCNEIGNDEAAIRAFVVEQLEKNESDDAYHTLLAMFPESDPVFLHTAVERMGDDEDAMKMFVTEQLEEMDGVKFETLLAVLPDADPDYLHDVFQKLGNDEESVKVFLMQTLESKDYPSREAYLKRQEMIAIQKKYKDEFIIEEFLEMIPDPWIHFAQENKNNNIELVRSHGMAYLESRYRRISLDDLIQSFKNSKYNLTLTCRNLDNWIGPLESQRHTFNCTVPNMENIPVSFLQEVAFIENEERINDFIQIKKLLKKEAFEMAKAKGELLECQCCYDSDVMIEDVAPCNEGHLFCKDCIRRSVEVKIGNGQSNFSCLTDCVSEFSLQVLRTVLKPTVLSRLVQRKQMEEIQSAGIEDLESCPFCDFATILPSDDKVFLCFNPECMQDSCRKCKRPNHIPLHCDEVDSKEVKMRTFIEDRMTDALVRTCWKCKRKFIKELGCNKMTCTCGAIICYICRQPVTNYNHFNGQGGTEFHKCPLYSDLQVIHDVAVQEEGLKAKKEVQAQNPEIELKHDPTIIKPTE